MSLLTPTEDEASPEQYSLALRINIQEMEECETFALQPWSNTNEEPELNLFGIIWNMPSNEEQVMWSWKHRSRRLRSQRMRITPKMSWIVWEKGTTEHFKVKRNQSFR